MKGSTYVTVIKTRLGVASNKLRSSRGRVNAPVLCDLGGGQGETLGHILQSCPKLAPERTKRHDRVLSLLIDQLTKHDHHMLKEPNIRTPAGLITSDSSLENTLERAHGLKRTYYDVEDIREWVRTKTGHSPVFATLTINWRGVMATPSYMALKTLGLTTHA